MTKRYKQFLKELDIRKYKKIIVLESHFGWEALMKQRPQQIVSHFGSDILSVYHSDRDKYDTLNSYKKLCDNLYLANMNLYRKKFIESLKSFKDKYLITYSTDAFSPEQIREYQQAGFKIIYEYVDRIDPVLSGKVGAQILIKKRDILLADRDVFVVCTASDLYDSLAGRARVALVTNGCDYDFFDRNSFNKSVGKTVRVGYYGALASWVDYKLIKKIAANKQYEIVFFGIDYDNSLSKSRILKLSNVKFEGRVDYCELPARASEFDICIIPFLINDITLATSPVKLFEYLAMGKPVVSTALPECYKYPCVFVAESHEDFLDKLLEAKEVAADPEYISLAKKTALENSWHSKCAEILSLVEEV